MRKYAKLFILGVLCAVLMSNACTQDQSDDLKDSVTSEPSKLVVVWTSGDREVAIKMVYMYTYNAKKNGWWDNIRFIVWGPSSKLLSEDKEIQEYTQKMKDVGVEVFACKACADMYGISEKLEELGLEVKFIGEDLTEMLQGGWTHLTF
jgi:hypothetical protein